MYVSRPIAAISAPTGGLRLDTLPELVEVPDDAVLVDVSLCGICGTDVHIHGGQMPGASPAVFGHEWVGRIREVGRKVTGMRPGDRVAVGTSAPCGGCKPCRAGHEDQCRRVSDQNRGIHRQAGDWGGFASYVVASADRLVPVPDRVEDVAAAMLEPASVAYRAVRRSGAEDSDVVVVLGGGPIGLFAAQHARMRGAHVVLVEPNDARRSVARGLGIDRTCSPGSEAEAVVAGLSEGLGADVVLECTGVPAVLSGAGDLLRPGGTVMVVGVPGAPVTFDISTWIRAETTWRATIAYSRADVLATLDLLASGDVRVTGMHTGTIGLDGLSALLTELDENPGAHCKVLVSPGSEPEGDPR